MGQCFLITKLRCWYDEPPTSQRVGKAYNLSTGNPVKLSSENPTDQTTSGLTSLHSVFVSRPYFSGKSFLHLLQTRQPNVFLKLWSISIVWHSLHFGFIAGSSDISSNISVYSRDGTRKDTYEAPYCVLLVLSLDVSPFLSSPHLPPYHPQPSIPPWCLPSSRGHNQSICQVWSPEREVSASLGS